MKEMKAYDAQMNVSTIEMKWWTDTDENAKQDRDSTARKMRKGGWAVESEKYDFSDMARCVQYSLIATKKGKVF